MQSNENPADDVAITSSDAARLLGVSVSTAQMWMERGMLESWKTPGGHRRTRRSAVAKLLERISTSLVADHGRRGTASEITPYPLPGDERERLRALQETGLLDGQDAGFDRITRIANQLFGTSIALVTLLSEQHQHFKSKQGLDVTETPRAWAFCSHAILQDDLFMVADASEDPRFRHNPLVLAAPYIRFYAGVPLVHDGFALGTLCVIDREPRILRSIDRQALRDLGAVANDLVALRVRQKQAA